MTLVQPKAGFHTGGGGGNLTGIVSDYIIPVLAAGKNITVVAADTAAGLYDAAVACQNYQNTTSVLCYRTTDQRSIGGFDFDALANNFAISPEENAALHWAAFEPTIPPELLPYKSSLELIILNEIRGKQTDEPVYQGLHIGEYLGRFALAYRALTDWRLLFFGFASGEPDPDVWEQPSMLDLLRVCGERPYDTGIALHEYSYNVNDILDGYPYKVGRFMFLFNVCEQHGIPWPRVVISEWGWTLDNVPDPAKAIDDIDGVFGYEYGPFEQIAGAAIWWLGPQFGGIADKVQRLIKPLGDYIVNTLYDVEIVQPQQPPDGGGGEPVTTEIKSTVTYGTIEGRIKVRPQRWDSTLKNWVATGPAQYLDLPAGTKRIAIDDEVEVEEPTDPNPPPVVTTLPRRSRGVDLSAYQKGFFSKVSPDKFDFFMFRCSDGMNTSATSNYHDANGIDTALLEFADVGHASGKPWGIYHFLRPNNIEAQISKVRAIYQVLVDRGTPPRAGKFEDGAIFAGIWADVEDYSLTNAIVKQFVAGVGIVSTTGIYTGKYVWESVTAGADVWWSNKPLWLAAYGANNGQVPPWTSPSIPRGWTAVNVWQYTSEGQLVITEWPGDGLDLNSAGPYAPATPPPPPPPTGQTVDLLPYFKPSGKHGRYVVFHFSDGRTQAQQMELLADGRTILWKGEGQQIDGKTVNDYEEIRADDSGIRKFKDTSSGGRTAYDLAGVVWLPRFVQVGKVYESKPTVRNFDRVNCQTTTTAITTDYIYVKELLPVWTSPINPAIKFNNVLVCEWRKTLDINTPPIEVYKLAVDVLYCEWNNGAVGELPEGRQPLSFQLTNCQ